MQRFESLAARTEIASPMPSPATASSGVAVRVAREWAVSTYDP